MADNTRAQRLAKRIQTIVASAIERQIKDRRLELVTVTDVRVTGDLHDATVYYTVRGADIDDEPDLDQAAEALHRARGQLRKIMGDELGVRFTPTLSFELDTVPEASARMEELLARARARDEELAELKKNATPAGDADPYKTRDE
ncbi:MULTISPECIES: 30S ribosome-binding factor RbfA [unclassified Corynebacterium]|uniref:30S ribosome-binding factor RbfA n=1 Tax=unclassified Corynebacterium TaxID=2624378 RepID=UPI0021A9CBB8|nr:MULTISPECIES: 30S ribosome-binding factor RbfA [unclassified Corynebacterium]MCT1451364.1 30S ribosome-binding factor RbfA [Corynebacterium sp. p3-SID1145]MCT1460628.1 30S ribosome-binding factor RbfA [Corynebacterium sp. p3-SID1140]MDN8593736.1 30S ribosome-binding factor RbfA [Corynebacterium sp. P4_F2]WKK55850.1 30S ribosome-binding factor RbfA [Corynebacterium sp. P4-C1]WKK63258.1 30S ribosome-binding factor RbfA [Corynebacterium sp. P8-C1]